MACGFTTRHFLLLAFIAASHVSPLGRPSLAEAVPLWRPWHAEEYCRVTTQVECGFGADAPPSPGKKRILILVAGVKERLYPISAMRHIILPAVRAGFEVDYYAILSTQVEGAKSWRTYWYRPVANPLFANVSDAALERYLTQRARFYGARRVGIFLLPKDVDIDPLPEMIFRNKRYLGESFGIGDQSGKFESSGTFWLLLKRLKKVEMLWNWTAGHRMSNEYDHVVWTRSDTYWVDDLDMTHFPDKWTVYSRAFGALCVKGAPGVINDQTIVLGANVAGDILTAYSAFYTNEDAGLNRAGCFEGFLMALAAGKGITWKIVRKDWFPFFLALHMSPAQGQEPVLCFRGLPRKCVLEPESECVHPSKVSAALCDDFQLQ